MYHTLMIGRQLWMAANLNHLLTGSWCFGDDPDKCKTEGRLYDWAAARQVCPQVWHLPTDDEWKALEIEIGLASSEVDKDGWRGKDEALSLKEGSAFGFNARMGGYRQPSGFTNYLSDANFWTATEVNEHLARQRMLVTSENSIGRLPIGKKAGLYVRCVKT